MKRLVPKIIQLTLQMLWLSWKAEALWTDNPAYYVWLERKIPRNAIMGLCKTVTLHHPAFRFTCWQFTHPCRSYMIIYWYYNTYIYIYIYICILHGYVVSISWESHSSYSSRGVPWLLSDVLNGRVFNVERLMLLERVERFVASPTFQRLCKVVPGAGWMITADIFGRWGALGIFVGL